VHKELELWQFIDERLKRDENVMLLVVAESSGSSPGRKGNKMAVGADGKLTGTIGGGVMEVNLVEESRRLLSVPPAVAGGFREQVHRKDAPDSSGMICSGRQTVIFTRLTPEDEIQVGTIVDALGPGERLYLKLTPNGMNLIPPRNPPATAGGTDKTDPPDAAVHANDADASSFTRTDTDFVYIERLGVKNDLYIIGGGHCALALSEIMSKMDFHISLFDDRPELNTIAKNKYAHDIKIVDSYDLIGDHIPSGPSAYVVVMTLGYKTDEIVIRSLIGKEFKYFGVLGSKAKMSTMFKSMKDDGVPDEKLQAIRAPIGLPIKSHSPEEIAISIAAEIISVKNG
jgi:xanthine dehydrogenase accessory factor